MSKKYTNQKIKKVLSLKKNHKNTHLVFEINPKNLHLALILCKPHIWSLKLYSKKATFGPWKTILKIEYVLKIYIFENSNLGLGKLLLKKNVWALKKLS